MSNQNKLFSFFTNLKNKINSFISNVTYSSKNNAEKIYTLNTNTKEYSKIDNYLKYVVSQKIKESANNQRTHANMFNNLSNERRISPFNNNENNPTCLSLIDYFNNNINDNNLREENENINNSIENKNNILSSLSGGVRKCKNIYKNENRIISLIGRKNPRHFFNEESNNSTSIEYDKDYFETDTDIYEMNNNKNKVTESRKNKRQKLKLKSNLQFSKPINTNNNDIKRLDNE